MHAACSRKYHLKLLGKETAGKTKLNTISSLSSLEAIADAGHVLFSSIILK